MITKKLFRSIQVFFLLVLVLLIATCKPERDNLWDVLANLDPDKWAPQNLTVEDINILEKRINWAYDGNSKIEGFKLDRQVGNDNWELAYQVFDKGVKSWNDTDVIPDSTIKYSYRLYSFAGENKSAEIAITSKPVFLTPTNLQIEKINDISYKLTWDDNTTGEQGFKVDRRTNNEDWIISHGIVEANQTMYIDTNVFVTKSSINVEYRVYAFYQTYESTKTLANTNAALTSPTNLEIAQNSLSSVTLKWGFENCGHDGFKIDRKTIGGSWQNEFVKVDSKQTTYTDNTVNLESNGYTYRIYAFIGQYNSGKSEISISKPAITTANITVITGTSATSGGNVTDNGGLDITARGVCWSTTDNPTISDGHTSEGIGSGSFSSSITDLQLGTKYYLRAYATNGIGTSYGNTVFFTTLTLPQVTTQSIINITSTSGTGTGIVNSDGGSLVTERGICFSTLSMPTLSDNKIASGSGTGNFTVVLGSLDPSTFYYVRAYAISNAGVVYGNEVTFTTNQIRYGDSYGGGIVFYIFIKDDPGYIEDECHGLIAAPTDQGQFQWGCSGSFIGQTSSGLGTGLANTIAIINSCSNSNCAAKICYDLELNGYSDWFLPSMRELSLLRDRGSSVGGFSDGYWWSSTEINSTESYASYRYGTGFYPERYEKKTSRFNVRAIRMF